MPMPNTEVDEGHWEMNRGWICEHWLAHCYHKLTQRFESEHLHLRAPKSTLFLDIDSTWSIHLQHAVARIPLRKLPPNVLPRMQIRITIISDCEAAANNSCDSGSILRVP